LQADVRDAVASRRVWFRIFGVAKMRGANCQHSNIVNARFNAESTPSEEQRLSAYTKSRLMLSAAEQGNSANEANYDLHISLN
jgi:hypothetical protein